MGPLTLIAYFVGGKRGENLVPHTYSTNLRELLGGIYSDIYYEVSHAEK